jgi:hypothetical protein
VLEKHASASIVAYVDRFDGLEASMGKERFASLGRRIAAHDPLLLDSSRFLYLRCRAVSEGEHWGANENGDFFSSTELVSRHPTFLYTPAYLDHNNLMAQNAVGIQVAVVHHPGPQPGGWTEVVKAVDRERAAAIHVGHLPGQPTVLTAVKTGQVTDTSMGCFVEYSLCSVCGNRAEEIRDYCPHVANLKGQWVTEGGKKVMVYEDNRGVTFFEDSIITSRLDQGGGGADLNAKILSEVAAAQMKTTASGVRHWTELIVDRRSLILKEMAMKKTEAQSVKAVVNGPDANSVTTTVGTPARVTQTDAGGGEGDYSDADKDKKLFDQAKGKSSPSATPTVIDNPAEKLSQASGETDHPLGAATAVTAEADPAHAIGGKPEEVLDAEQAIEEIEADAVSDKKDPKQVAEDNDSMEERHDKEEAETEMTFGQRLRGYVASILKVQDRGTPDGEGTRQLQDYIRTAQSTQAKLLEEADASVSGKLKERAERRAETIQIDINKAIAKIVRASTDIEYAARLDKKAEQFGGNPQQLVDFQDIYEQGNPDKNLYKQSKPGSSKSGPPKVGPKGKVSQDEGADHAPPEHGEVLALLKRGVWHRDGTFTAGRMRFAATDSSHILDKIESFVDQGMAYEEAEERAFQELATRIVRHNASRRRLSFQPGDRVSIPTNETWGDVPGTVLEVLPDGTVKVEQDKADEIGDSGIRSVPADQLKPEASTRAPKLTGARADLLRRVSRGRPSMEFMSDAQIQAHTLRTSREDPYLGEDPRGGGSMSPEKQLQKGNAETLASPATRGVATPGEFVRSSDPTAHRPVQPVEGRHRTAAEDPEDRLDAGNGPTLESPSTSDVAGEGQEMADRKSAMDGMGTTTPPREHVLSTQNATLQRLILENKRLRARDQRRAQGERVVQAKAAVNIMVGKGMFAGNPVIQNRAAKAEFVRLCKLPAGEFREAVRMVQAARSGSTVPRWNKKVRMSAREGSVANPVNQPPREQSNDEAVLSGMFDQ